MKIIIRADATQQRGTGHVFRTLVLAEELMSRGADVKYCSKYMEDSMKKRLESHRLSVINIVSDDYINLSEVVHRERPDWFIVDHYDYTDKQFQFLKQSGAKVMAIDDINETSFPVNILLNQNMGVSRDDYQCNENTKIFCGPKFALIKNAYVSKRNQASIRRTLNRVLIFMGGSDEHNQTLKVLQGVEESCREIDIDVVLGPAFEHRESIDRFVANSLKKINVYQNLNDLSDLMLKADLAIGSGGIVTWEMAILKLPMILMPIAENQNKNAIGLSRIGAALHAGWWEDIQSDDIALILNGITDLELEKMSRLSSTISDGSGMKVMMDEILGVTHGK